MPRYNPDHIAQTRRSVVTHDAAVPPQSRCASRVIDWLILTADRPRILRPAGEVIPFRRRLRAWPSPATPFGGDAA